MRKLYAVFGLLIVASMILAACGPTPTAVPTAAATQPPAAATEAPPATEVVPTGPQSKDPTTFVEVTIGDADTLDPALAYDTASGEVIQNVYETLVFYDGNATDKFVPMLAEEMPTISEDGKTYTFKMRQGVKFHEGGDLTPSDVAYSFWRGLLQGGYDSPQWLLTEPFFAIGVSDVGELVGDGAAAGDPDAMKLQDPAALAAVCEQVKAAIVADDAAGTVTITLAQPWGPFIPTIAQTWGSVMDEQWVVENGGWDGSCDTWVNFYAISSGDNIFSTIANGTGPFKLDHWTPGEEIVLVRNDNYWREPAKLERFIIKSIDEWGTRFAMLQAGDGDYIAVPRENTPQVDPMVGERCQFDIAANAYPETCEMVDETKPLRLYIGRPAIVHQDVFMNFNIAQPEGGNPYLGSATLDGNGIPPDFFSDVHIRKAFNYCFDWDVYISDVFQGEAIQTFVVPIAGMPGYDINAPHYSYDLAKCEEEFKLADLDKDGIAAGDDPEGDVWTTGFRLQMTYNQGNTSRQAVAEIIASNVGGVNDKFAVETLGLPWPSFLRAIRAKMMPAFVSGWQEDIHDAHNWYQPYLVGTYANRQNLPDDLKAAFQDLINKGVAESDPAKRAEIYAQLNQLQYDNPSLILLATGTSHGYVARWVDGWLTNPILAGIYAYPISKR